MKYVIDSSVAFKLAVPEVDSDKAEQLRDDYRNKVHELIAPSIFTKELAHALTRAERQKRVTQGQALILWLDVMRTCPHLFPTDPLLPRAIDISSNMRIGVYDCAYVSLAEQEQCELITADAKLIKNLQSQFPFIKDLASMP